MGRGQHAAPGATKWRGRTVLRPPEGNATIAAGHAGPAHASRGGMELRSASVSMSRSTAARGCQAFLRDDVAA